MCRRRLHLESMKRGLEVLLSWAIFCCCEEGPIFGRVSSMSESLAHFVEAEGQSRGLRSTLGNRERPLEVVLGPQLVYQGGSRDRAARSAGDDEMPSATLDDTESIALKARTSVRLSR